MRHGKKINHLGRTSSHRKAMLANMASSLILNKRITTTTAKAKSLKTYVEPLITRAKNDNTHSRRKVFSYLKDKEAVSELFRDVAEKIGDRPGGYTRILKTGNRQGDNAEMCFIELVDYNETYTASEGKAGGTSKRKRRRRGGKKKSQKSGESQDQTAQAGDQSDQHEQPEESSSGEATAQTPSQESAQEGGPSDQASQPDEAQKKDDSGQDQKKEE